MVRLLRFVFCSCVGNYIGDYVLVFFVFDVEVYFVKFVFSIGKFIVIYFFFFGVKKVFFYLYCYFFKNI